MFRYLVAHIPTFRLDRCGWLPHQPVALVAEEKNALRVQAITSAAHQAGVRPGMSAATARARCPVIETDLLDPDAEADDLLALTTQLLRVSPSIAPLPPEAIVAEISRGPSSVAGSERAVLERVRIRMGQLGHEAHVVVADDPITALTLAKWWRRSAVIPSGGSAVALGGLPLAALELPEPDHALLKSLGLTAIRDLTALPPSAISGRLSPSIVAAHTWASGHDTVPTLSTWSQEGPPSLHQDLPAPVAERDALVFVIGALVRDLSTRLLTRGQAITQVSLSFRLDGGRHQSLNIRLGAPTRHATTILDRIRYRLDRLQLGGPVVALTLSCSAPTAFEGRQTDLRDPRRSDEALEGISARLQDALGSRSVLGVRTTPRHRPEGAWRPVPFGTSVPKNSGAASAALALSHSDDPVEAWAGHPPEAPPERPPILLDPPLIIEAEIDANRLLRSIHVDGRWLSITNTVGPEQLNGEWWSRPFQRAYWRATLEDGRTAWLYREQGRWALHGWWDR